MLLGWRFERSSFNTGCHDGSHSGLAQFFQNIRTIGFQSVFQNHKTYAIYKM